MVLHINQKHLLHHISPFNRPSFQ